MSLEVRVHNEIMGYQPKVMWGMSWRQIATVGVGLPLVAGIYAASWFLGATGIGEWLVMVVTVPFVLYGWVRPKGLPFEVYARYVLATVVVDKPLVMFISTPVFASDMGVANDANSRSPRNTKKTSGRAERSNY